MLILRNGMLTTEENTQAEAEAEAEVTDEMLDDFFAQALD